MLPPAARPPLVAGLLVLALAAPACAQESPSEASEPDTTADTTDVYTQTTPSRDGTGKMYMGREISQVMGHRGAQWLERPERARDEKPNLLVDSMALAPDAVAADLGAGTGYFTFRIAPTVPEGRVFAVDIQPEMLSIMEDTIEAQGIDNVTLVEGTVRDPNLPADSIDAALMVDAYHEFSHPREMMLNLREALVPGGRVYLVEYRKEDPSIPIKPLHKMSEAQAKKEMRAVGLEWVETKEMLPRQHFMVFQKPTGSAEAGASD
ncbi:MAG: methyltransferase domain-containing protein [Salinibacter sp.]